MDRKKTLNFRLLYSISTCDRADKSTRSHKRERPPPPNFQFSAPAASRVFHPFCRPGGGVALVWNSPSGKGRPHGSPGIRGRAATGRGVRWKFARPRSERSAAPGDRTPPSPPSAEAFERGQHPPRDDPQLPAWTGCPPSPRSGETRSTPRPPGRSTSACGTLSSTPTTPSSTTRRTAPGSARRNTAAGAWLGYGTD